MIRLIRSTQPWVFVRILRPRKLSAIHNNATHRCGMPIHIFGSGMHHNVRAPLYRTTVNWCGECVIHYQRHTMGMSHLGKLLYVQNLNRRIGYGFTKQNLGIRPERGCYFLLRRIGTHKSHINAKLLQSDGKQIERTAVNG